MTLVLLAGEQNSFGREVDHQLFLNGQAFAVGNHGVFRPPGSREQKPKSVVGASQVLAVIPPLSMGLTISIIWDPPRFPRMRW